MKPFNSLKALFRKKQIVRDISQPIVLEEVTALVRYASENGIDPGGNTLLGISNAVTEFKKKSQSPPEEVPGEILTLYSKLAKACDNVNGRTLLDTGDAGWVLARYFMVTGTLLVLAIGNEILAQWFADLPEEFEGWMSVLYNVRRYVLEYLSPFLWGALGACVYLLKKLYDIAADRKFDRNRLHGWYLRVILGAILAGVIYYLFDLSDMVEEGEEANAKGIAFLIGIGVKVVYGSLEKLIVFASEKLNLTAVRSAQVNPAVYRSSSASTSIKKKSTDTSVDE